MKNPLFAAYCRGGFEKGTAMSPHHKQVNEYDIIVTAQEAADMFAVLAGYKKYADEQGLPHGLDGIIAILLDLLDFNSELETFQEITQNI